jgi:hypothetical protein
MTMNVVLGQPDEKIVWPAHPDDLQIPVFDTGVFINEMAKLKILPKRLKNLSDKDQSELRQNPENLLEKAQEQAPKALTEGTYRGTQLALTKIYGLIEERYEKFTRAQAPNDLEAAYPSMRELD